MEKVNPNGFKGQIVCYDRECCVLYKKELDRLLGEQTSTIVMDTNNDKEDRYKEWRRDRDGEAKVLDDFRDPNNPLQLVIVTSKLLTGFDAPILQVMYLDKPMKDHTLLQAICRTNHKAGYNFTMDWLLRCITVDVTGQPYFGQLSSVSIEDIKKAVQATDDRIGLCLDEIASRHVKAVLSANAAPKISSTQRP